MEHKRLNDFIASHQTISKLEKGVRVRHPKKSGIPGSGLRIRTRNPVKNPVLLYARVKQKNQDEKSSWIDDELKELYKQKEYAHHIKTVKKIVWKLFGKKYEIRKRLNFFLIKPPKTLNHQKNFISFIQKS